MNWARFRTAATIKKQLPLAFVCAHEGIDLEPTYDGRLIGACPFHDDQHPSFAVFGDHMDKVGCWSCDFSHGDVFDLIQRLNPGYGFKDAVEYASHLLDLFEKEDDWKPNYAPRPAFDPTALRDLARQAWLNAAADLGAVRDLIAARRLDVEAEWLHREFHVGTVPPATVIIPHLSPGYGVTAVKLRYLANPPYAVAGSRLEQLYGIWRRRGHRPIVLAEGESDTWTAAWRWPDLDTAGLQAGAGTYPREELIASLGDADPVYLAFDGDDAGDDGASRWLHALNGRGKIVDIPRGRDLSTWRGARLP